MKKFVFAVALVACVMMVITTTLAQDSPQIIMPSAHLTVNSVERTPEQMDAFAATYVPPAQRATPFHPTVNETDYRQMKEAAKAAAMQARPTGAAALTAPPVFGSKFVGPTECDTGSGCWVPPDSNGTIGKSQFVSTDNDIFAVYSKAGLLLKEVSLNAFFGYGAQPMFDPRVQYDETWNRFIVTADAFKQSSTSQIFGIAVSQTSSATGKWWIYLIDVGGFGGAGGFYDFPMLGESQDAVIFTANVFTATAFQGSSEFSIAKARLYNGKGFSVPVFLGLVATMQPSHQILGQDGFAWMAAAPTNNNQIFMLRINYPASPQNTTLQGYFTVPVTAYTVPPGAVQPSPCGGGTNALDTSDNRFVNAGTQNGDLFYQAHSVAFGPAAGRYYIIKGLTAATPTLQEQGTFFTTASSADFNVSIAADSSNRMVLNWTSVSSSFNPQVRFNGKLSTDPVISGGGSLLFQSAACLSGNFDPNFGEQRWGDYSQVSVDPVTAKTFWIINETVPNTAFWSTEVGKVHF
jgi:hypothetical protein